MEFKSKAGHIYNVMKNITAIHSRSDILFKRVALLGVHGVPVMQASAKCVLRVTLAYINVMCHTTNSVTARTRCSLYGFKYLCAVGVVYP